MVNVKPQARLNPIRQQVLGNLLETTPARREIKVIRNNEVVSAPGPAVLPIPRYPLAANVQVRNIDRLAKRWI